MNKPLQLQKLPKAGRLSYLNYKRTTPGNFTRLINPGQASSNDVVVNPSHPWARKSPKFLMKKFPYFESFALTIRAFPKALLLKPPQPAPSPPYIPARESIYGIDGKLEGPGRTLNMALMHVVAKKVHKSSVVRAKIRNRLKTALSLIVTRGATVEKVDSDPSGRERLVLSDSEEFGEGWVLQDWTYVIHPTLDVYRLPYTTLIRLLRHGLSRINTKAALVEQQWDEPDASENRNDYSTTKTPTRAPIGETRKRQLTRSDPSFSSSRSLPEPEDLPYTGHANSSMARIKALLNTPSVPDTSEIPDEHISEDFILGGELMKARPSTSKPGRPIPVWARPDFDEEPSNLPPASKSPDSAPISKPLSRLPVSKPLSQPSVPNPLSQPSVPKPLSQPSVLKPLSQTAISKASSPSPAPPASKGISLSGVLFSQKPIIKTNNSQNGGQEWSGDRTRRPRDRNQNQRRGK